MLQRQQTRDRFQENERAYEIIQQQQDDLIQRFQREADAQQVPLDVREDLDGVFRINEVVQSSLYCVGFSNPESHMPRDQLIVIGGVMSQRQYDYMTRHITFLNEHGYLQVRPNENLFGAEGLATANFDEVNVHDVDSLDIQFYSQYDIPLIEGMPRYMVERAQERHVAAQEQAVQQRHEMEAQMIRQQYVGADEILRRLEY